MGHMVEFPSNGGAAQGYFAASATGSGPAVLVIQEWWGLVAHIQEVVDRFAAEGFTALAPDLYRGATTTEPDEAGKLMMALNLEQAAKDLRGAIAYLKASDATSSEGVGVIGFCMGGGLALVVACNEPQDVVACAPYYGLIQWAGAVLDYSKLSCSVHGHYAENDGFFSPALAKALEQDLVQTYGKDAVLQIHPGVDHAFFNDHRPEVYSHEEATAAFAETVAFFRDAVH